VIRAPIAELVPGERRITGATARYLARVLRLRAGDTFVAFDPASGLETQAVTVWAEHDAVTVRFGALRDGTVRARRPVTWIQGLAKADKCDAIVRDATELGATRIVVAKTRRTVVKLDAAHALERRSRWERIAREAARQCGRSDPPAVDSAHAWRNALALISGDAARFCLWEKAVVPLGPALFEALARNVALAFACGPEGGLEDDEVDLARAEGWSISSLGDIALRTETVAAAVLGAARVWASAFEPTRDDLEPGP
jgi:16S rRNA (uracil1498-N3)-methyltransferase